MAQQQGNIVTAVVASRSDADEDDESSVPPVVATASGTGGEQSEATVESEGEPDLRGSPNVGSHAAAGESTAAPVSDASASEERESDALVWADSDSSVDASNASDEPNDGTSVTAGGEARAQVPDSSASGSEALVWADSSDSSIFEASAAGDELKVNSDAAGEARRAPVPDSPVSDTGGGKSEKGAVESESAAESQNDGRCLVDRSPVPDESPASSSAEDPESDATAQFAWADSVSSAEEESSPPAGAGAGATLRVSAAGLRRSIADDLSSIGSSASSAEEAIVAGSSASGSSEPTEEAVVVVGLSAVAGSSEPSTEKAVVVEPPAVLASEVTTKEAASPKPPPPTPPQSPRSDGADADDAREIAPPPSPTKHESEIDPTDAPSTAMLDSCSDDLKSDTTLAMTYSDVSAEQPTDAFDNGDGDDDLPSPESTDETVVTKPRPPMCGDDLSAFESPLSTEETSSVATAAPLPPPPKRRMLKLKPPRASSRRRDKDKTHGRPAATAPSNPIVHHRGDHCADDAATAASSLAERQWEEAATILRAAPSLMSGHILRLALRNRPPLHVVAFMLDLNPGAAAVPERGPSALQVAVRHGAGMDVVERIVGACPYALFTGNGSYDPLTYAKIWRREEEDLIELLSRPISHWVDANGGGTSRSHNRRRATSPREKRSASSPGRHRSVRIDPGDALPGEERRELSNLKLITAAVVKSQRKHAADASRDRSEAAANLRALESREQRAREELLDYFQCHGRKTTTKAHLVALDMKEKAFEARLGRTLEGLLLQSLAEQEAGFERREAREETARASAEAHLSGMRDDILCAANRVERACSSYGVRLADLAERVDGESAKSAAFREDVRVTQNVLEERIEMVASSQNFIVHAAPPSDGEERPEKKDELQPLFSKSEDSSDSDTGNDATFSDDWNVRSCSSGEEEPQKKSTWLKMKSKISRKKNFRETKRFFHIML